MYGLKNHLSANNQSTTVHISYRACDALGTTMYRHWIALGTV